MNSPDSAGAAAEIVDLYTRAAAFFGEQVIAVGDQEWDLPTPAGEWIVKAVVAHVVVAEAQIPEVINGMPFVRSDADMSILGHDPVSVWRGTAVNALHAIAAADLDQVVQHPVGAMPLRTVVGFRITENLVHGWDLAVARDADVVLDAEISAWSLDFWLPFSDGLGSGEFFGPMREPTDDTPGARLLALLGR
jgi:uncharacterized protein (TIGR03086 family)